MIALQGDREKALAQAKPWMVERGGGSYHIVGEEVAVVGQSAPAAFGGSAITESRIRYECGPAPTASR